MNREKNIPEESNLKERRVFLKKAIYSAPTLLTLGSMTRAKANNAGSEIVPLPPSSSQQSSSSWSQ